MSSAAGPLILTPGDPDGIGPEVVCKALAARARDGRPVHAVVVGDVRAVRAVGGPLGVELLEPASGPEPVEVRALRFAVDAIREGRASALVTGPIHKERLAAAGFAFTGHTDFLAHLCDVADPVMAFVGGRVRVALVTVHIPVARVPAALTTERVLHTLRVADRALRAQLGLVSPRLLVCGLNPHAGDGGVLGREDLEIVAPAVAAARAEGLDAEGPVSAEAAFQRAVEGDAAMVIAMYHDQGLVPLKALGAAGLGRSVNWTLGLPVVRTSVDHGTADDIAGKGVADPGSMLAAIELAEALVARAGATRAG